MSPEPSRSELLNRIAELEARLAAYDTGASLAAFTREITERKQVERALREREQQLVSIYNAVRDVIFHLAVEPEGQFRFVSVNAAFLRVTGLSREMVVGKTVNEVIPEPSLTMVLGKYRKAVEAKTIVSWEEISDYPAGRLTGEVNIAPVLDEEGTCTYLVGSVHDITDRKHAEATLRESEERFRTVADTAPVMIWMAGLDKLRSFVNKPWLEFRGRTMEQELGNSWLSGVHPDDQARCLTTYSSSFDARRSFQMEYRLRRAKGEYRWLLDNGTPFYRDGELAGYIGSCVDITEQKLIEERLRGSETRLKDAQRLAKVGSFERNLENDTAYWSDEMFRIYGLLNQTPPSSAELLNLVYADDRQKLLEAHDLVRSSGAPVDIEFRIVRPNGELRCARAILEAVRDDRGAVSSMVGATQDVTDLKRAQDETFARQKLESLGALASGIAHDFNNLLGAVLAQTELAMTELATGSHPNEELKAIRDVAIRGSEIVRQLMIYAGKESDVLEPVDVSKVVERMLGLLKVAVSRRAELVTNPGKDLPPVWARGAQLSQIVMNLVVNASDALGDRDGVIRVNTEHITVGRAEAIAMALPVGDYVQLEVSDTGCGLSPETQAKMFDPFFTTKFSGRGLGLAVVHGIVRSLHGAIQVASEPGKGTTFQVLLPCAETAAKSDSGRVFPVEECAPPAPRRTILIVEDEEQLRLAVAKMLRKSGSEALEAASGSAAIDLLRARGREIDLILLDLTIPGSSSRDVVAEAALARPDVKVILTSAYSEEVAKPMMRAPSVCGFIRKPFKLGDFMQAVRSVLSS